MAHYRVIPLLPKLPPAFGVDELDYVTPVTPVTPEPPSRKVIWMIPTLIFAIAVVCLALFFMN